MVGRPPSSHPKPARGRVAGTGLRAGAEGGPRPCCRAPSPALTTLVAAAPPVAAGLAAPPGLGAVAQLHPVSPLQGKEEFEKTQKELLEKGQKADYEKVLAEIKSAYTDGESYELDGFSVEYPDWHFNVRCSNTEPLLRLIVEAKDEKLMIEKRDELLKIIRQ